jgi:hypothetical protein
VLTFFSTGSPRNAEEISELYYFSVMKLFQLIPFASLLTFSFSFPVNNESVPGCDEIPALNEQIIKYVQTKISKKVGRGECWDLAAGALNTVGAHWDKNYGFGRTVNEKKECVFPGDIIQLEGVTVKYKKGNMHYTESMQHHTAIIYEVKEKYFFTLAGQNTGTTGKKVGLNPLNLRDITRGTYTIYRPVK